MEQNFQVRDVFNEKVVNQLAANLARVWPEFDADGFSHSINTRIKSLTFSERAALIRDSLWEYLPRDYPRALQIILDALPYELSDCEFTGYDNFIILPQNEFVAKYGLEHYDLSMQALYQMTKRFSAEGAIRAFILKYPAQTLAILSGWAEDEHCHVRRLVSEGTRPRLPWTVQLKPFIEDPRPVLALLDKLKRDPTLMVRRSVANNLNDIAKDNPDLVVRTLRKWKAIEEEGTQWLIRHAARTLVKQGNKDVLAVLGYDPKVEVKISKLQLDKSVLKMGDDLNFSFEVKSTSRQKQNLVIDYVIHHVKANGRLTPKVFKLTQKTLKAEETLRISKKHSFRLISTRKYYAGKHALEIQINGVKYGNVEFELR
ncbi:MAG TPA: DNA alkylation repair protein [Anaerolineales bacterium]|nr:DNA alkylation repair protein [Anaerolineales bacterium]